MRSETDGLAPALQNGYARSTIVTVLFLTAPAFVWSATTGKLSGSLTRLNWLPFKSALRNDFIAPRNSGYSGRLAGRSKTE